MGVEILGIRFLCKIVSMSMVRGGRGGDHLVSGMCGAYGRDGLGFVAASLL